MAYSLRFQQSPNYWKGRSQTIKAIAIHWWGDPTAGLTLNGVVNTFMKPERQASAHYVASGTNREVVQMVKESDTSWATNSANPYTISIECDPRCRTQDYSVVAELIADIRKRHGDLPLVPHSQFSPTQCPGNYDLGRLDRLAREKGQSMATRGQKRIAWSEILGRPYLRTHKGEFDKGIDQNIGGMEYGEWIERKLWPSAEAKAFRARRELALAYYKEKAVHDVERAALAEAQKKIEQLSTRPTKAEYAAMQADLQGIIADKNEAIAELEKQIEDQEEETVPPNWFVRFLTSIGQAIKDFLERG